jgi:uncharacterized protein
VNELSRGNKRPLHWAAQRGQVECVERLLSLGADKECVGNDGLTPLLSAAANGRFGVVAALLEAGEKKRRENGKEERILTRTKGANVDALTPEGLTALHLVAREGDVSSMALLVKSTPRLVKILTGNKALIWVCCLIFSF